MPGNRSQGQMTALYELTGRYRDVMNRVVNWETGEVDEDAVPNFGALMEGIEDDIKTKLENCGKMLRAMSTDIVAIKEEEARLAKRRASLERNYGALKEYVGGCMRMADLRNVKTRLFTIYFSGAQDVVEIPNEKVVPKEYRKKAVEPPPDKARIKAALKAGTEFAWAKLVKGKEPLVVR